MEHETGNTKPERQQHIIRRQTFELSCPSAREAEVWQRRWGELWRNALLPELEAQFDRACPPGRHLLIDRLELDLGVIAAESFEEDVLDRLGAWLRQELIKLTAVDNPPASRQEAVVDGNYRALSPDSARLELLLHFLATGRLPWWATEGDLADGLWHELPDDLSADVRERLTQALESAAVRQRLAYQFSDQNLFRLVKVLSPDGELLAALLSGLLDAGASPALSPPASELRLLLWRSALAALGPAPSADSGPQTLIEFWSSLFSGDALAPNSWLAHLEGAALPAYLHEPARAAFYQALDRFERPFAGNSKAKPAQLQERGLAPQAESAESEAGRELEVYGIAVARAGLVLLWPYWAHLFKSCNWLKQGGWRGREEQQQAVHLLHYLASGRRGAVEPELVLAKLLCGLELEAPIARQVELTEPELLAADELLTAAIGHWPALKRTSAAGLRSAFLQRPGLLKRQERGWLLQVERRSHDVLLEQLPWGMGMIKLSWMPDTLTVEW